jgi:hypothetical protein
MNPNQEREELLQRRKYIIFLTAAAVLGLLAYYSMKTYKSVPAPYGNRPTPSFLSSSTPDLPTTSLKSYYAPLPRPSCRYELKK